MFSETQAPYAAHSMSKNKNENEHHLTIGQRSKCQATGGSWPLTTDVRESRSIAFCVETKR